MQIQSSKVNLNFMVPNVFLSEEYLNFIRSTFSLDSQSIDNLGNIWLLSISAFELVVAGEALVRNADLGQGQFRPQTECRSDEPNYRDASY